MREDGLHIVVGMHELLAEARKMVSSAERAVLVEGFDIAGAAWHRALIQGFQERARRWAAVDAPAPACRLDLLHLPLQEPHSDPGWPDPAEFGDEVDVRSRAAHPGVSPTLSDGLTLIVDNEFALVVARPRSDFDRVGDRAARQPAAGYLMRGPAAARLSIRIARRWNMDYARDGLTPDISAQRINHRRASGIEDAQRRIGLLVSRRTPPPSTRPHIGRMTQAFEAFC